MLVVKTYRDQIEYAKMLSDYEMDEDWAIEVVQMAKGTFRDIERQNKLIKHYIYFVYGIAKDGE